MKRVIVIFLAVVILLNTTAFSVSAASYSTGTYTVTSSNGVNVRSGAGTNYKRVGAARNGVSFSVSRISGGWGYTDGIQCTNGVRSGWVYLSNCRYNGAGPSRQSYITVFASPKGSGYSLSQGLAAKTTTFQKGSFMYAWAYIHDGNGNLYKSYGTRTWDMTLWIYRPDGSCAHTYTYKNSDNNWIGCKLNQAGTWKIRCKITGQLSGESTQTITVKEQSNPSYNTTKTVTINASTLEAWSKEIKQAELGITGLGKAVTNGSDIWIEGNLIVGREILSYKTIRVFVPNGGPVTSNYGKYVNVKLPYKIRYTIHQHTYSAKANAQYWGNFMVGLVNMQIVHTMQCSCGKAYTLTWEMPELSFDKVKAEDTYTVRSLYSDRPH